MSCSHVLQFRDDSSPVCGSMEFVSCLKASYVDIDKPKYSEVAVHNMQVTEDKVAFVRNEVTWVTCLHV